MGVGVGGTAQYTPIESGANSYIFHETMGQVLVSLVKGGGASRGGVEGHGVIIFRGDFGMSILRVMSDDRMCRPSSRTHI
jgi:hypothetical protein